MLSSLGRSTPPARSLVGATYARHRLLVLAVLAALIGTLSGGPSVASAADTITWGAPQQVVNQAPFSARVKINGISCPTAGFCAAVTDRGAVLTSAGTAGPWTTRFADCSTRLNDIACPTANLCVTLTESNEIYVSTTRPARRPGR